MQLVNQILFEQRFEVYDFDRRVKQKNSLFIIVV